MLNRTKRKLLKKIVFKINSKNFIANIDGKQALTATRLFLSEIKTKDKTEDNVKNKNAALGYAAINLMIRLWGENSAEKLLKSSADCPGILARKFFRLLKRKLYPFAMKYQRKKERERLMTYR